MSGRAASPATEFTCCSCEVNRRASRSIVADRPAENWYLPVPSSPGSAVGKVASRKLDSAKRPAAKGAKRKRTLLSPSRGSNGLPEKSVFSSGKATWNESIPPHTKLSDLTKVLVVRSEEHTSELQSQSNLVCRLLL